MPKKQIVLLGATGSIGESTLKVIRTHPDKLQLNAIAANSNYQKLAEIAQEFQVTHVCVFDASAYQEAQLSGLFSNQKLHHGLEGLKTLATLPKADLVEIAITGTLGLQPALSALEAGKNIAVASKEILVLGGSLITQAAKANNCQILPIDSEHSAIFQCLQGESINAVEKIILTASGGPFRTYSKEQFNSITKEQALNHPTWNMGPKVTIDSATLANKALELMEAYWLFDIEVDQLGVVVHPQSIVHSIVQFKDASMIAQMSPPKMTYPIQYALLYPERHAKPDAALDLSESLNLEFSPPDLERFPCLKIAFDVMKQKGNATGVYNAANEIAVDAFLKDQISFNQIPEVIGQAVLKVDSPEVDNLKDLLAIDQQARKFAQNYIQSLS